MAPPLNSSDWTAEKNVTDVGASDRKVFEVEAFGDAEAAPPHRFLVVMVTEITLELLKMKTMKQSEVVVTGVNES